MASMIGYKWLSVLDTTPSEEGGLSLNQNFKDIADAAGPSVQIDRDPLPTDDINAGYYVWSKWHNTVTDVVWTCVNNNPGLAEWVSGGGTSPGGVNESIQYNSNGNFDGDAFFTRTATQVILQQSIDDEGITLVNPLGTQSLTLAHSGIEAFIKGSNQLTISSGGELIVTAAINKAMYFDAGNTIYWRDTDTGLNVRMTLDTATGNVWIGGNLEVVGPITGSGGFTSIGINRLAVTDYPLVANQTVPGQGIVLFDSSGIEAIVTNVQADGNSRIQATKELSAIGDKINLMTDASTVMITVDSQNLYFAQRANDTGVVIERVVGGGVIELYTSGNGHQYLEVSNNLYVKTSGVFYIVDSSNNELFTFNTATARLAIGRNDIDHGDVYLYGDGIGSSQGGQILTFNAADFSTPNNYFKSAAFGGEYIIGRTTFPDFKIKANGDIEVANYFQAGGYFSSDGTGGKTADVPVAGPVSGTRTLHFKDGLYIGFTDS